MIHNNINLLDASIQEKARAAVNEMNSDAKLKELGATGVAVVETLREMQVQMAYFSRSRMAPSDVQAMYRAAGLYAISADDAQKPVTSKLDSNHMKGKAIDIAPTLNGAYWWKAPKELWERMGEIGERHGLSWGGRWKTTGTWKISDTPHFEI